MAEVARELEVRPDMLRRWRRSLAGEKSAPSEMELENRQPRRDLQDLRNVREERDILKKALAIFSYRRPCGTRW